MASPAGRWNSPEKDSRTAPPSAADPGPPSVQLRVATYNVRVDHPEDVGTFHDWPMRCGLVASTIESLAADVIALQETSSAQITDLRTALGSDWGVEAANCDPEAWTTCPDATGPADPGRREGNGLVWRRSRLQFLDVKTFWLSSSPDAPWPVEAIMDENGNERGWVGAWGGSPYQRTCMLVRFKDLRTGRTVAVMSTRFDNAGDDQLETGGAESRRQAAALVMERARMIMQKGADVVCVCGDFATFHDRQGATHSALTAAADGALVDVREAAGVLETDSGRGSSSWEGWENNPWRREAAGEQRYDQIFVSANAQVARATVFEARYPLYWDGDYVWVYASEHLPVVADVLIPLGRGARRPAGGGAPPPGQPPSNCTHLTPRAAACLVMLSILCSLLMVVIGVLVWDLLSNTIECRFQCRSRLIDPPFDNITCAVPSGGLGA